MTPAIMTPREAAEKLAGIGIATIPIPLGAKGPRLPNWPQKASVKCEDHDQFFGHGATNIGAATGSKSGIFALDVDRKSGGIETLVRLEAEHGSLPKTPKQKTGGGGWHFLFRLPATLAIRNAQNLAPGLDVRGEGGVIVISPSIHASGNLYEWEPGLAPWETRISAAPAWLLDMLGEKPKQKPTPTTLGGKRSQVVVDPEQVANYAEVEATAEAIVVGCAAIEMAYKAPEEISEWHWKMTLGIIGRAKDGRRLAQYMSSLDDTRYSAHDTDRALDHVLNDMKAPFTCNAFAETVPTICTACPFRHTITTPLQLGREESLLVGLQRAHVFVTEEDLYYDVERQLVKKSKDFSATYAHKVRGSPHHAFITSRTAPKVDRLMYLPGEQQRVVKDDRGVRIANTYLSDGIEAAPGDWSIWREHLEYLVPHEEGELDHLLNVMANTLQRPQQKVRHAILIKGGQRTGKSSIATAWGAMLGSSNVVKVSQGELESSFQGGIYNKQLAILEELYVKGRDRYDDLKEFISENEQRAQRKNVDFYSARTPFAILALTNRDLPIMIPEADDGRWFVIHSHATQREKSYYERLHGAEGTAQIAAFKSALLARDVSDFNANSPPPMTSAKRQMIHDSRSPVDKALESVLARKSTPFVIPEELSNEYEMVRVRASESQIRDALSKFGGRPLGQIRLANQRVSPWAWRDAEKWKSASASEIRLALSNSKDETPTGGTIGGRDVSLFS